MEAVPPPEELPQAPEDESATARAKDRRAKATFEGWPALVTLVWATPQFLRLWLV